MFSLTPIFLFSLFGALRLLGPRSRLRRRPWLTLLLTAAMFAFYTWNPKARNYGGSTQGLRWLFWLIPFWLVMLPAGVEAGQRSRRRPRALAGGAVRLGLLGRLRPAHPLEPSLAPRRPGAPEPLHAEAVTLRYH